MENVLTVSNLKKTFRNDRGIENVSFSIEKGDVFGLLGANGAGKTTTMKIVAGLMRADSGEIKIFNHFSATAMDYDFETAMTHIGALIETPSFYSYLSVEQNMKLAAQYYLSKNITEKDIDDSLAQVKLLPYKNDKVGKFSLGMKQRMGLALAMLGDPMLYILDEPSSGLDIEGIIEIRNIILELAKNSKASFLLSSHQAAEIQKTCNKVGVIHNGVLKETAHIDTILEQFSSVEDYYLHCVKGGNGGVTT